ncbi:MAG: hypothetical protein ACRD40_15520 [Candidatus Acidiferrales bacterium]
MNRNCYLTRVLAVVIVGVASVALIAAAHSYRAPDAASVRTGSAVQLVPDKGKFRILADGKEVGQEDFEINRSNGGWVVRGNSTIQTAKGAAHINGTLELKADGSPVRYDWATDGDKKAAAVVTFNGAAAEIALNVANTNPYKQQLSFSTTPVVLDNNLYDQYAVLAGLYDWSKKGVQTFSVLVPQSLAPGTISVESLGKQDANGKQMDELRVKSDDLELNLFLDKGRLMRIDVPAGNAEIVRD